MKEPRIQTFEYSHRGKLTGFWGVKVGLNVILNPDHEDGYFLSQSDAIEAAKRSIKQSIENLR